MILLFDNDSLQLNVRAGALENYTADEAVKTLAVKADELKDKVRAKQLEMAEIYKKFVQEEVEPIRAEIRKEVLEINKKNNPELEKVLAQEEVKQGS